ncbi:hypothetical protein SSPO_099910 [Streptomyces antimycoticus]|uniref:Uncharacterized protein n=1 Tax=Streptomyces antimycoticus TaxID=68175 RepID=A0A499UYW5_9ACTN|nr:hypothetical protein SSPO_099910 [Streptomyces antimycoticus]
MSGFELLGGLPAVARVGDEGAARVGEEVGDPQIDADRRAGRRKQFGLGLLGSQHDEPLTALALHGHGLDGADNCPVLVHLDVPDTLKSHAGDGAVRGGVPAAAVAVLGKVDRVEPVDPAKTRVSGCLAGFDPPEERRERFVETAQRRLLRGERPAPLTLRVECPDLLELRGLHPVLDVRLRRVPVGVAAFL